MPSGGSLGVTSENISTRGHSSPQELLVVDTDNSLIELMCNLSQKVKVRGYREKGGQGVRLAFEKHGGVRQWYIRGEECSG